MTNPKQHYGVIVPMITPFTRDGRLDERAVRRVIDFLIEGGIHGIFVLGTTGERASVPVAMQSRLVQLTTEHVRRRVRTYVGISDTSLANSVELASQCSRYGVDAVVAHAPSYFPLTSQDIIDYFCQLTAQIELPLVLYNIPSTTHVSLSPDVIAKLSEHTRIVALKDSENTIGRPEAIMDRLGSRADFSLLMGASVLSAKALFLGMDGIVPSSGNLVPVHWRRMFDCSLLQDWTEVGRVQEALDELAGVLQKNRTIGQSIAALKVGMSMFNLCEPPVLPPLRPLEELEVEKIARDLRALALLADEEMRASLTSPGKAR